MSVYYSTKSKDLYVATFGDFESYKFHIDLIQEQLIEFNICIPEKGCYPYYKKIEPRIIDPLKEENISGKKIIKESIVHESYLLDYLWEE